jgi:hypothetical protein
MEEHKNTISLIFEIIRFLSVVSIGIFVGSMLTEGCVLVPYWRSLSADDFYTWYAANGQRLQDFFGPITTITALLSITAATVSLLEKHPKKWFALLAAIISLAVVSTFFLYFKEANLSFANAGLKDDELAKELIRWSKWHWIRTGMSFLAFTASLICFWKR